MVRRRGHARAGGDPRGRGRADPLRAGAVGRHLLRVDAQHPALVHLAPALVGPSDPRLVRAGSGRVRRAGRGGGRRRSPPALRPGGRAGPRRGRPRHLVLVRAVAVLDAGLARAHARAAALLPDQRAGHGLRHHLLLGRADDDARAQVHGRGAVPRGLHPRPRARRARPEDEQEQGQRDRSARADRPVRRRRAPVRDPRQHDPGPRHPLRREPGRGLSQLRHQALERRALLRAERLRSRPGLRSGGLPSERQPLGLEQARPGGRADPGGDRELPLQRCRERALRVHLERVLRLVSGARQAPARRRRCGGERGDPGDRRLRAGQAVAPVASADAVRHRGALGSALRRSGRPADRSRAGPSLGPSSSTPMPRPSWTG